MRGEAPAVSKGPTISRCFARWALGLRYEDLPPAVVDKAQALLLQAPTGGTLGANSCSEQDPAHVGAQDASAQLGLYLGHSGLIDSTGRVEDDARW
jgi:hypothetical protein